MRALPIFAMAYLLSSQAPAHAIVGGDYVDNYKDANFMVQTDGLCGGSVMNSKWILTAAHCAPNDLRTVSGGNLATMNFNERLWVSKVIRHPKYERILNGLASRYDFALLRLGQEIDFKTSDLRPVKLADPQFASTGQAPGIMATVFGWGFVGQNDLGMASYLRYVQVPIVSMETANLPQVYNHYLENEPSMLPAGYYIEGGKDACSGDSGGPLTVDSKITNADGSVTTEKVQVGVVSWADGCAQRNKVGLYGKVSEAYDWIMKTMAEN